MGSYFQLTCNKMLVQTFLLPLFILQTNSAPQRSLACIFGCTRSHSIDIVNETENPISLRSAISVINHNFHNNCQGQLNMVPSKQYRNLRVKYEKLPSKSKNHWSIKRNRRKNKVKISYISIQGNCCWRTCDRNGLCDNYGLSEEKPPKFKSIFTISTVEC